MLNKPSLSFSGSILQNTVMLAIDMTDSFVVSTSRGRMVSQPPPKIHDTISKYPAWLNSPRHNMKMMSGLTRDIMVVTVMNRNSPINKNAS
ncbi:hypothetical protein D3C81_1331780 [compost metagenome]